jgi:cyclophilin family peptidyl-prolyl cis-trans isomerase
MIFLSTTTTKHQTSSIYLEDSRLSPSDMASLRRIRLAPLVQPQRTARRGFARGGSSGGGWYKQYEEDGPESFQRYNPPTPFDWSKAGKTATAFFDISIAGEKAGTVHIELLDELLPVTVGNFKKLCTGDNAHGFSYEGTPIHRVVKGASIVGGDVEHKTGEGSHSALGERYFNDEALLMPHSGPGIVSMVNGGVDTNGSQFYITTAACPHLDGYSVAFGRVTQGMDVVDKVTALFSIRGKTVSPVVVSASGLVE